MNIKITKNIEEANLITHAGTFHADEVFSTIILSKIIPDITLIRVQEFTDDIKRKMNKEAIVYDIGIGPFDHHQLGGNGERENGIKYAACGLIWKEFGKQVIEKYIGEDIEYTFDYIDRNLIQFIDANDNGQLPKLKDPFSNFHLAHVVGLFNSKWNEKVDQDEKFIQVLGLVEIIFDEFMKDTIAKVNAKEMVNEAIENSKDGLLILEDCVPWKQFLIESESEKAKKINFAVFPSKRGGYNVYAVPKELGSFENRKNLPKKWRGLRDKDLQAATGIKSARFCHNAGFICSLDDYDDTLKLAKMANDSLE